MASWHDPCMFPKPLSHISIHERSVEGTEATEIDLSFQKASTSSGCPATRTGYNANCFWRSWPAYTRWKIAFFYWVVQKGFKASKQFCTHNGNCSWNKGLWLRSAPTHGSRCSWRAKSTYQIMDRYSHFKKVRWGLQARTRLCINWLIKLAYLKKEWVKTSRSRSAWKL